MLSPWSVAMLFWNVELYRKLGHMVCTTGSRMKGNGTVFLFNSVWVLFYNTSRARVSRSWAKYTRLSVFSEAGVYTCCRFSSCVVFTTVLTYLQHFCHQKSIKLWLWILQGVFLYIKINTERGLQWAGSFPAVQGNTAKIKKEKKKM